MRLALLAILGFAICGFGRTPLKAASQEGGTSQLKVHVIYAGNGKVDEKHKVYVVLWDSPDFATGEGGSMPVEIKFLGSKDGDATFAVQKTPAYVSTVYDASGSWDAQSPPPDGCSLGLYHDTPGKPAPINLEAGKTKTIEVRFDDSVKMVAGKATRTPQQ